MLTAGMQPDQLADLDIETPARFGPRDHEAVWELPERIGLAAEMGRLREVLDEWVEAGDPEVREMLRYQLDAKAKSFRPVTIFACHRATDDAPGKPSFDEVVRLAAALELFHNYTLVVDDIVDRDRYRRGKLALHCRFGSVPGLAAGAYLAFGAADIVASDPFATRAFDALGKRIVAAECRQWRLRRRAFGVDEWRRLAGEDTGAMFETCARVALRGERLARYGYLLGSLYHGCDDVADIRGTTALGTASEKDVTDRILTLVAAIATEDPQTAELFEEGGPEANEELGQRLHDALPRAEQVLDQIALEAESEARANAEDPEPLLELIRYTRPLSQA